VVGLLWKVRALILAANNQITLQELFRQHVMQTTKLTESVTVAQFIQLEDANDRVACGDFIVQRFQERYFAPALHAETRHGFTLMTVACLVIEALECFYQGKEDSSGNTRRIFKSFFERRTGLECFGADGDWFYLDIRCGILHQAETKGGWRVRRAGQLLDTRARTINAYTFVLHLQRAVDAYAKQLEVDDELWGKFRTKMAAVCKNCEHPE
jgi:hypothetical protein